MRSDLLSHSPYGQLLGSDLRRADPAKGEIEMAYVARPDFTNRVGTVSGGMLSAMLDSVTGLVVLITLPEELVPVTITLNVTFVAPAQQGEIIARARITSRDGRNVMSEGELFDSTGTQVASATSTLKILHNRQRKLTGKTPN